MGQPAARVPGLRVHPCRAVHAQLQGGHGGAAAAVPAVHVQRGQGHPERVDGRPGDAAAGLAGEGRGKLGPLRLRLQHQREIHRGGQLPEHPLPPSRPEGGGGGRHGAGARVLRAVPGAEANHGESDDRRPPGARHRDQRGNRAASAADSRAQR